MTAINLYSYLYENTREGHELSRLHSENDFSACYVHDDSLDAKCPSVEFRSLKLNQAEQMYKKKQIAIS